MNERSIKMYSVICSIIVSAVVHAHGQSCHGGGGGGGSMPNMDHEKHRRTEKPPQVPTVQTLCPVMERGANRSIFADWEGDSKNAAKRVYFCCNECVEKFNKNPARYVRKLRRMDQPVENHFPPEKNGLDAAEADKGGK